jgi:hypothetical protein
VKPKLEEVALNVLAFDQTPLSDVKPSISHQQLFEMSLFAVKNDDS